MRSKNWFPQNLDQRKEKTVKISRIDVFPVRVLMKKAVESAHGRATDQDSVVVRVRTASGESGIGAIEPRTGYDEESMEEIVQTLQGSLIPKILGEDPFQIRKILEVMDAATPAHLGSKAIIEMALFDLVGKTLQVPVYVLLGGKVKDTILLNGWVGLVKPEQAKQEAQDLFNRGFRSLKIKINGDIEGGRKRVEAVRAGLKDKMEIRVDANESLNMEQARKTAEYLKPFDILYLEQPFPRESFQDFAALAKTSPIKLMADESIHDSETLLQYLKAQAAHFVKVKVQKMGGLLKTLQAVQVAQAFGIPVILGHGFGLTINTLAELHLAACTRGIIDGCEAVGPFKMADDVVKEPLFMEKGYFILSEKPGLGVELDEDKIKQYRVK
jgi:L-alanine-DL-glutamate epimerase-like enolase superfamily enzyme